MSRVTCCVALFDRLSPPSPPIPQPPTPSPEFYHVINAASGKGRQGDRILSRYHFESREDLADKLGQKVCVQGTIRLLHRGQMSAHA